VLDSVLVAHPVAPVVELSPARLLAKRAAEAARAAEEGGRDGDVTLPCKTPGDPPDVVVEAEGFVEHQDPASEWLLGKGEVGAAAAAADFHG